MELSYIEFTEQHLELLTDFYMAYYNTKGGTWTYEKASKRIRQIASMEDSLVLMQFDGTQLTGFLMGYFQYFDDCTGFFLEEILIGSAFQNKGLGSAFLLHLKSELKRTDCDWIELLTTTQPQHQNFYSKNGYAKSKKTVLEYLDLK